MRNNFRSKFLRTCKFPLGECEALWRWQRLRVFCGRERKWRVCRRLVLYKCSKGKVGNTYLISNTTCWKNWSARDAALADVGLRDRGGGRWFEVAWGARRGFAVFDVLMRCVLMADNLGEWLSENTNLHSFFFILITLFNANILFISIFLIVYNFLLNFTQLFCYIDITR